MRHHPAFLSLSLVLGASHLRAAGDETAMPPKPAVDSSALIESSYKFLREREPTMTEEEYALYDRVVPMVRLQPEFALRLLEGMIGDEEASAAFDLALGNVYYEQKRRQDAETRYREAVRKFPNFIRAWDNLGILYLDAQEYAKAVPCFSKVVSLGGWEARIFGLLGFCLARSNNPIAAEIAYMQACTIEPDNADWVDGLLQVVLQSEQYDRAETLLRQLTRIQPRESRHWMTLASVLVTMERRIDAIAALDVASGLGVLEQDGVELLGDLYAAAGFVPEAIATYRKVATTAPAMGVERLLRFADLLADSGETEQAEKILADLEPLVSGPQRAGFLHARARLLVGAQRWDDARRVLDELLTLNPLDGPALLHLAEIHLAQGDPTRAMFALEPATRVEEVAHRACLQLAQIKVGQREFDEALALIEKALSLQDSPLVRDYRAHVKALADNHE